MTEMEIATDKKAKNSSTTPIRVKKITARAIRAILTKCNRKTLGRKVTVDDVVNKAIALLTDAQIEEIKVSTYSSSDRLELQYKEYCKAHGSISKDEYLGKLLEVGNLNLD